MGRSKLGSDLFFPTLLPFCSSSFVVRVMGDSVTERELHEAVRSTEDVLGSVMEFTVIIDERTVPRAYGFLVELAQEEEPGTPQIPSLSSYSSSLQLVHNFVPGITAETAPTRLQTVLAARNETFAQSILKGSVGKPTVRVLAPGTFGSYRKWRIQTSKGGCGQMKVPSVIYDATVRDWFLARVVGELGVGSSQ